MLPTETSLMFFTNWIWIFGLTTLGVSSKTFNCKRGSYVIPNNPTITVNDAEHYCSLFKSSLASFNNLPEDVVTAILEDCGITQELTSTYFIKPVNKQCCRMISAVSKDLVFTSESDCNLCSDFGYVLCERGAAPVSTTASSTPKSSSTVALRENWCSQADKWIDIGRNSFCLTEKSAGLSEGQILCQQLNGYIFNITDDNFTLLKEVVAGFGLFSDRNDQIWLNTTGIQCNSDGGLTVPSLELPRNDLISTLSTPCVDYQKSLRVLCQRPNNKTRNLTFLASASSKTVLTTEPVTKSTKFFSTDDFVLTSTGDLLSSTFQSISALSLFSGFDLSTTSVLRNDLTPISTQPPRASLTTGSSGIFTSTIIPEFSVTSTSVFSTSSTEDVLSSAKGSSSTSLETFSSKSQEVTQSSAAWLQFHYTSTLFGESKELTPTNSVEQTKTTEPPELKTTPNNGNPWIEIGSREYFVNNNKSTYEEARTFCKEKFNASLVAFSDITMYFNLIPQLSLKPEHFWVDDPIVPAGDDCLVLQADTKLLTLSECHHQFNSVCNRFLYLKNVTQVVESPSFQKIIKELTVDKDNTALSRMQKISAEDRRTSAKVSGGIAILIISAILSLLVFSDVTKLIPNRQE